MKTTLMLALLLLGMKANAQMLGWTNGLNGSQISPPYIIAPHCGTPPTDGETVISVCMIECPVEYAIGEDWLCHLSTTDGIELSLYAQTYKEDDQDAPQVIEPLFINYNAPVKPMTVRQWSIDDINELMHQSPKNPPAKNTYFYSVYDDRTGVRQTIDIAPDGKITLTGLTMEDAVLILAGRIAEFEKEAR